MARMLAVCALVALLIGGCAVESRRRLASEDVASNREPHSGPTVPLAVGQFFNSSPYMRGIFSEGPDRLGSQSKTILKTHLSRTNRFQVFDRDNMGDLASESELGGVEQDLRGARYVITGEVTEFGRRTTGGRALFGILGRGKSQLAYSKVSLNVVDSRTSAIVFSVQGAGEYKLSQAEFLGTGGTSSYDTTLNGKVLNLSIVEAVDRLVAGMEAGEWHPLENR